MLVLAATGMLALATPVVSAPAADPAGVRCAADDPVVWLNTVEARYYYPDAARYGRGTGGYVCRSDAEASGAREGVSGANPDVSPSPEPTATAWPTPNWVSYSYTFPPSPAPTVFPSPPPTPRPTPTSAVVTPTPVPNYATRRVFFATDRLAGAARPSSVPEDRWVVEYRGDRNGDDVTPEGHLDYGVADVSIPNDHVRGVLESPKSIAGITFNADPAKHIKILHSQVETIEQIRAELRAMTNGRANRDREVFIFVHGFNVPFNDALRRTAQLAIDLEITGPAFTYSFPSAGSASPLSYTKDLNDALWSVSHLKAFIMEVAQDTGGRKIHVLAHSMGGFVLSRALAELAAAHSAPANVQDVVLAAADIDRGQFAQIADAVKSSARHVTVYAASSDLALVGSHKVNGYTRLGDAHPLPEILPGIDSIDATAVDTSFLGHGYYADNVEMLSDLRDLFASQQPPRSLLELVSVQAGTYYRFVKTKH